MLWSSKKRRFPYASALVAATLALSMGESAYALSDNVAALKVTAPNGVQLIALSPNTAGITSGSQLIDGDEVSWSLDIIDPDHRASANGFIQVKNLSSEARAYALELLLPLSDPITNTVIGGSTKITLTTNANGGSITCPPGATALAEHLHDGQKAAASFYCPFAASVSGAATMSTTSVYGAPIPSLASIDASSYVSIAFRPLLTDGDTANAFISVKVDGDEVPPSVGDPVIPPVDQGPLPPAQDPDEIQNSSENGPPAATPTPDPVSQATPVPTAAPSIAESGSIALDWIRKRAPNIVVRLNREGMAASTYPTQLSASGRRGRRKFDCVVGQVAPGDSSVLATLRLAQGVRGKLELSAAVLSSGASLNASTAAKLRAPAQIPGRKRSETTCPVRLVRVR